MKTIITALTLTLAAMIVLKGFDSVPGLPSRPVVDTWYSVAQPVKTQAANAIVSTVINAFIFSPWLT